MNKKYNKFEIKGNVVEVKYNNVNETFLCDLEDWMENKKHCWVKDGSGYPVARTSNGKNNRFHQIVMSIPDGMYCDHISRDRADNRKSNLRVVTPSENNENISIRSDNKTGCTGVSYYKNLDKYRAYITVGRKQKSLGYFKNLTDAIVARVTEGEKHNIYTDRAILCELEEEKQ